MGKETMIENGQIQVQVCLEKDTIWLSQAQMAELFDKDSDTIGLHLRNIYKSGELEKSATTEESSVVRQEGKRQVNRKIKFYNLDAIISVGYRVNSKKGTRFRMWATQRLKEYLVKGYSINQHRFEQNAVELQQAIALIQKAAQSPSMATDMGRGLVDILSRYTQTFLWLQQYDEGLLIEPEGQSGGRLATPEAAMASLFELKKKLKEKVEASDLLANPSRADNLAAIFGNLDQSAFGEPAYPTIESKAAHLLYFVVKNHPFTDGNKRSGAFLFVDFLHRNGCLLSENGISFLNDYLIQEIDVQASH